MKKNIKQIRTFDSGADRDTANGKIQYTKFTHPLCEHSFGQYMLKHQKRSDGTMREGDNWWGGWDTSISLDSMQRHLMDLRAIQAGYQVYKERLETGEERTHYVKGKNILFPDDLVTEEDCCNAIRFNADAYKLQLLK